MQVWPRPNLRAQRPPGSRQALLLVAEEAPAAAPCCGGGTLVWDGWDLRGQPFPHFEMAVPLPAAIVGMDQPLWLQVQYKMTMGQYGASYGRIEVSAALDSIGNQDLEGLLVGVRITVPWARFDASYVCPLSADARIYQHEGGRTFRQRWRIKPYSGLAIVSAIITRNRAPRPCEWSILHDIPE